ncbi:MAG: MBL fold metallo-hydrolase, partial [Bacillota bacterium]
MLKEIKEVGRRGVIFQYDDQNLVYLIKGDNRLYLCDTHLGPKSMKIVRDYIQDNGLEDKELVIFNSHSDYDHNWGNGVFKNNIIIAHEFNLERFKMRGEYDLELKKNFQNGDVELVYPNLTFKEKLYFADDEIEFVYAPGHTIDSAICIDKKDSTAYIGDLVEAPIPIVLWNDLEKYIESLSYLKSLSVENYIASHSGIVDEKLIDENLDYIQKLKKGEKLSFDDEGVYRIHKFNEKSLLMQKFQKKAKDKLKDNFSLKKFKKDFWKEFGDNYNDLANEF